MFINLRKKLTQCTWIYKVYQLRFPTLDLIYKLDDLRPEYYERVKDVQDAELEHQVGRLINFKAIIHEIAQRSLPGDILEFGSWKGFSLLWFAYLLEREGVFSKKIIGYDGFVGLPESEGVFNFGAFRDTSYLSCVQALRRTPYLYSRTKENIHIEQAMFKETDKIRSRLQQLGSTSFVLIHLDCDLSSSTQDVFSLLENNNLLADECFVLFDDYGCGSNLSKTVDAWIEKKREQWQVEVHSQTKLTKNFKFIKKYNI